MSTRSGIARTQRCVAVERILEPLAAGQLCPWRRTIRGPVPKHRQATKFGPCGAMGKLTGGKWLKNTLEGYTTLVRAIPDLVLILLLYYAGTDGINRMIMSIGLQPIEVNGLVAAVFVLGFVYGAFSTEVLRAGIQAVPVGQIEAAKAYGMSPFLRFRRIILPAMLPYAIPGMANLWLNITKASALISVVGFTELALATQSGGWRQQALFDVLRYFSIGLPLHYADFEPGIRLAGTTREAGPAKIGLRQYGLGLASTIPSTSCPRALPDFCFAFLVSRHWIYAGHSHRACSGDWALAVALSGARLLHLHSRDPAVGPVMASLLWRRFALSNHWRRISHI